MEGFTNLREMPFETLLRTVEAYPWFGAAQKVLCEQMSRIGGKELSRKQFSDAALHVVSREKISSLLREEVSCTDSDIAELLKKYVKADEGGNEGEDAAEGAAEADKGVNSNFRGVGDYFSREQYEEARRGGIGWTRGVAAREKWRASSGSGPERGVSGVGGDGTAEETEWEKAAEAVRTGGAELPIEDFCTEPIAKIYEEQGYLDRAKEIYAKLILAYPEKSAYFASLIEKLNLRNKN